MSPLNFEEPPAREFRLGKPFRLLIGVSTLAIALLIGSTLASNINLNSGAPVEFGQGVSRFTACDEQVRVTPIATYFNSLGGGFRFSAITLSDLDGTSQDDLADKGCAGKSFTIRSYDSSGNLLTPTYSITLDSAGNFSSSDGETLGSSEGQIESAVTLTFSVPMINTELVHNVTVETGVTEVFLAFQGPLTGPEAYFGVSQLNATKFAINKFNSQNSRYLVKLIVTDDQGDQAQAGALASSLITQYPEIIGVIGPSYSGAVVAALPYYLAEGIALVSSSASRTALTDPNSNQYGSPIFHRTVSTNKVQGIETADYAIEGIALPKVYAVDAGYSWSGEITTSILEHLNPSHIAGTETFNTVTQGTIDFGPIVARINAAQSNSVIFMGYSIDSARFVTRLRSSGYTGSITLNDMRGEPIFYEMAGSDAEGAKFISTLPRVSDFDPDLYSELVDFSQSIEGISWAQTIEATNVFLQGIAAGNLTRPTMLNWVNSYSGTGLNGEPLSFDQHGDRTGRGSTARYVVSGGNYVYVPR